MTSFSIFNKNAANYMDPNNWMWGNGYNGKNCKPDVNKLSPAQLVSTKVWDAQESLKALLFDDSIVKHVKINHGARAGTIARVDDFPGIINQYKRVDGYKRITLTFDDGKTVKMKYGSLFSDLKDGECAELLLNYSGKTVNLFTKNKRPPEVAMQIFDRFKKEINVGDWLLSSSFAIGKVRRISAKGTMWVSFIVRTGQDAANYADVRCSDPDTFAKLIVPEEFDSVAQLMDFNMAEMVADLAIDFKG